METTIYICFGILIILIIVEFWLVMKHFDYMFEHLIRVEKKIDELKSETNDLKK